MFSDQLVREINRVFYEVESQDYDETHPEILSDERANWSNLAKMIFPMLRGKNGKENLTIVDVGSGTGFVPIILLEYLSSRDTLICNDISEKMLSVARKKLDDQGCKAKVVYKVDDVESLDLSGYDVDLFTVNSTLHHLPNLDIFFDKVKRYLKKEGILVLAHEPNKRFANNVLLSSTYQMLSCKYLQPKRYWRKLRKILTQNEAFQQSKSLEQIVYEQLVSAKIIEKDDVQVDRHGIQMLGDIHSPTASGGVDKEKGLDPFEIMEKFNDFSPLLFQTKVFLGEIRFNNFVSKRYLPTLSKEIPQRWANIHPGFKKVLEESSYYEICNQR